MCVVQGHRMGGGGGGGGGGDIFTTIIAIYRYNYHPIVPCMVKIDCEYAFRCSCVVVPFVSSLYSSFVPHTHRISAVCRNRRSPGK